VISDLVFAALSVLLLFAGAEGLVRGAASMAIRLGLTPLVAGLTVVALGTSAPELVVSVKATLQGHGDIAVGNVVGSNIFNVGVILGLSALVRPLAASLPLIRVDTPIMIAVSLLVPLACHSGTIGRGIAALFVSGIVAYTAATIFMARRQACAPVAAEFEEGVPHRSSSVWLDVGCLVGGLALLVWGARLLVTSSISLATDLGVSEAVIGLTIVAAGTSMPELATSIVAAARKQSDIAVGNVVGSNIFNILGILGVAGVVKPITVYNIQVLDHAAMILFAVVLLPMLSGGKVIQRWEGALLLSGYGAYLYILWPS